MKHTLKMLMAAGTIAIAAGIMLIPIFATTVTETEPNDDTAHANTLRATQVMSAAIGTTGDADYFAIRGVNTYWGIIALLDTSAVTGSQQGELTMLSDDGTTILQSDVGSWEKGSGIALQSYANNDRNDHYLKVNESGDDQTIPNYTLRFYETVVSTKPETEPNDTPPSGTPSAMAHEGVLSTNTDVDCFRFSGHSGEEMIFALNGDPENDGSSANMALSLYKSDGSLLKTANRSGIGGNEFIDYDSLPEDGIYAYCVSVVGGSGGSTATYHVGLVKGNGQLYMPSTSQKLTRLDPPADEWLLPGDTITVHAAITNTDIITIPGGIKMSLRFTSATTPCLAMVQTDPSYTFLSSTVVQWDEALKPELAPGEVYSVTATFEALQPCTDYISYNPVLSYYDTSIGAGNSYYTIAHAIYLPLIMR